MLIMNSNDNPFKGKSDQYFELYIKFLKNGNVEFAENVREVAVRLKTREYIWELTNEASKGFDE